MYLKTTDKKQCYGCKVCAEICPQKCITFKEDTEHFLYPVINKEKCVNCGLCVKVCPFDNKKFCKKEDIRAYAGKYDSEDVLAKSSSGGAFTAIYKILINKGYTVFGVRWTEEYKVIHDSAITEEQCESFRKSKYVLSDTNHFFDKIKNILLEGGKVLFTGTPCQCAALNAFLKLKRISFENIIIIDLICHGAPSQYIFDKYINEKIDVSKSRYKYQFKNKIPYGGKVNSRTATLTDENGNIQILTTKNDPFLKGYYGRLFYRPSCSKCDFAVPERVSDMTIGDAWHIEDLYPEWDSLAGISLILVNSGKGKKLLEEILSSNMMELKQIEYEWAISSNSQLREPTQVHTKREKFFELLDSNSFSNTVNKLIKIPLYKKIYRVVKQFLISSLKALFVCVLIYICKL